MIVTQNGAGVKPFLQTGVLPANKPALKKTCRAVVPVAACRAKATKRGWGSDYFTDYTLTNKGEQALADSEANTSHRDGEGGMSSTFNILDAARAAFAEEGVIKIAQQAQVTRRLGKAGQT